MSSETQFLSFVVDRKLLKAIDNYRFEKRFESRADAIRELLKLGLKTDNPAAPD